MKPVSRLWLGGLKMLALTSLAVLVLPAPAAEMASFIGFTRPGSPNDVISDGKVIFAVDPQDPAKTALGGSVYFMVLERGKDNDDPWGTGLKDLVSSFRTGIDFNGVSSPALDTSAKYLYLYQVVNDRRPSTPLESAAVNLLVEIKDITSWGYFGEVDFATSESKDAAKEIVVRPVSFTNVVAPSATDKAYRSPAKAVTLPKLRLTKGKGQPVAEKGKIITVIWDALDPATNPDYVMLLGKSQSEENNTFRAIWSGKNILGKGRRSTVFGFTSNLPPTMEPCQLRSKRDTKSKDGIVPAKGTALLENKESQAVSDAASGIIEVAQADPKEGIVTAEGTVPTPQPETPASTPAGTSLPPLPSSVGGGPLGGGMPVGGGGVGGGGGFPGAGGIGFARPATGGSVIAGGGGTGQATQLPNQNGQQNINFNVSLTNQQAQAQAQAQDQSQGSTNNGGGHVVPAPAAWLLSLLGLPVLVRFARRKREPA